MIPIGERALEWVARYRDDIRPLHVLERDPGTLFLTARGQRLRANRLTELVHRYVVQSGIGKTGGCHVFCHTMATLMLEGGVDLRAIQAMPGHAQRTTTEVYTHMSITHLHTVHKHTHPANQERMALFDAGAAEEASAQD